jgi:hypothetical protein
MGTTPPEIAIEDPLESAAPVADSAAPASDGGMCARLRALRTDHPWTIEIAIFAMALVVYQVSRALVVGEPSQAFENATHIINWERSWGLFVEASVQEWVLNHVQLTEMLNYFYMSAHWIVTVLFFAWIYKRHARVYPYVRNAFLAANAIALVVYMLYPVAPPRLMGGERFVDTLAHVSEIDLQGGMLSGLFNPHAAVPSMHFGYAFMIAMVAVVLVRSWPLRLLALSYPAVVLFTIVGTANHYIADAVAGGIVIATGFLTIYLSMAARGQLSRPAPVPARAPVRRSPSAR